MSNNNRKVKDPDAVLDFVFDFAILGWLESGESITAYTVTADAGITVESDSNDGTAITVWLSGGTAGETYAVTVHITTSVSDGGGVYREEDRTMYIKVQER